MRNPKLRESIQDFSFGLLSSAINLVIHLVSLEMAIITSQPSPGSVWKALEQTSTVTGVSKESLRYAFWKAQRLGLLTRKRVRGRQYWLATEAGQKRLEETLPTYRTERPWDGKLYLVTYDIPEQKHSARDGLRKFLKKLGADKFQESVYLLLWDPSEALQNYIRDHALKGFVIVSDTGKDGSIGEMDVDDLVWNVFNLQELNARYNDFITKTQAKQQHPASLSLLYLSILKDDPQLPSNLLGPNWLGDKAHQVYQSLIKPGTPVTPQE